MTDKAEEPPSLVGATKEDVMSKGNAFGSAILRVRLGVPGTVGVAILTALPSVELPTLLVDNDLKYQVPALETVTVWSAVTPVAICVNVILSLEECKS